ncbi:MAG TPA: hypothetical protein ENI34_03670 [candidate division WOR-3 bacterium]|uniref:Uncharacterized protein n=1 Tax=candidate division WOR-3 bacterium TaxID=2052148 RepID=A0A9C9ELN9_UNCW3|nr:hypothetical protein [candidate division WOR-3 bacterium]
MVEEFLNNYEEKGLPTPFIVEKSGNLDITQSGESLKKEIAQMATIIFETIGAVGDVKIDTIEMIGEEKGLVMELQDERIVGSLFSAPKEHNIEEIRELLGKLKEAAGAAGEGAAAPREKPKVKLEPGFLDQMKEILKDYLGDFTERIYKNQLKAQRIDVDEFYDDDARRLIFALGKAAGMIIGPSKGREMTNKLLEILK